MTTRQPNGQAVFSPATVLGVVRSAQSLRYLAAHTSVGGELTTAFVGQLVAAAPQLVELGTDVYALTAEEACALLRDDAPFGAVRLRRLRASFYGVAGGVQFSSDGLKAVTAQLVSRHHVCLCANWRWRVTHCPSRALLTRLWMRSHRAAWLR